MPRTHVVFYQEGDDDIPVLEWLKELRRSDRRAYETCVAAIERLAEFGQELAFVFGGARIIMARTTSAVKILESVTGGDKAIKAGIARARVNLEVAQMIHDARNKAGLSQTQLAALIGTKQPVIARLEDADYEGHSLTMLRRIAEALGQRLEVRLVPKKSVRHKLQPA